MTTSNQLPLHADNTEQDDHLYDSVNPGEIAIGVVIGRTSEFFDFFVYAIASVLVFPKIIFTPMKPLEATLWTFAIFALGFIARPFGTIMFTAVERTWGRSSKMILALFLLGTSTVAIAFLPSYNQIGELAALLLAVCRIGQGLAWGGSWDGLPSLLAMHSPAQRTGWYTMIPQLGAMIGLCVSTILFVYFITQLSAEDFLDWGWRYPFFVAFAINVVALFARLRIVSTPEYKELFEHRELMPSSVVDTVEISGSNIILGAIAPLASFSLFHMVTVFPLSWVFLFTSQKPAHFLIIECVGALIGGTCVIGSGLVADRVGRRALLAVTAGVIAAFSGFAPQLLNAGEVGEVVYMVLGFILLGFAFGQSSGVMASNFPPNYRYTGSALTADLAWLFGAGFAPITALWLSSSFGLPMGGVYLLSGCVGTAIALLVNKQLEKNA
jgi:MFS family permease